MPVVVLAGSKTVIGLLAVVCVLVVLQLSPTGVLVCGLAPEEHLQTTFVCSRHMPMHAPAWAGTICG